MTRLLVLGPTGQLGRDVLVQAAAMPGFEAAALGRDDLDLGDPAAVTETVGPLEFDVLVNCAAYTAVDAAEADAATAFDINAYAVEEMARVCAATGRRFVHVSTDYVFDGESTRPYPPDAPPGPLNVYGASKLVGESLARRAHPGGTVVVRTSAVFGLAAVERGGGNFVETMLRLAGEGGPLRVVDDVTMAPTSSADLAGGLLRLIDADPGPGCYHLTNAGQATWYELARAILAGSGLEANVEPVASSEYPRPARRPAYSVLDTSATLELVGPLAHWEEALSRYLAQREEGLVS